MTAATVAAVRGRGRTARHRMRPGKIAGRVGFYILIAAFVVGSLFPFYWIVITSLKTPAELSGGTTSLLPGHITFGSYSADLTQTSTTGLNFGRSLLNSAIVALAATAITVVLAVLAGYALSRTRMRGKGPVLGFVLIAGFFPPLAMVGPLFLAYRHIGLLNSYPALVITYLIYTLPLATWFLANFFSQLPRQLEEAAVVDGASRLQALRRVILPVAVPGIFTVAILSFILAWNDFAFAVSFMETPDKYTAPLAIIGLGQSQYQVFYNRIDAAVVMVTLPVALLVIFAQRRIISGLTAGALK
jgi:ABC-type glycerol-3-phosphate transport system permease component